jgi:hypothetical protein
MKQLVSHLSRHIAEALTVAEAQRKKSQAAGRSLSQADLDQYRTL